MEKSIQKNNEKVKHYSPRAMLKKSSTLCLQVNGNEIAVQDYNPETDSLSASFFGPDEKTISYYLQNESGLKKVDTELHATTYVFPASPPLNSDNPKGPAHFNPSSPFSS